MKSCGFIVILVLTLAFGGCSLLDGGMPDQSFKIDDDLAQLQSNLKAYATVDAYYKATVNATDAQKMEARNRFIGTRLVTTNINYLKFIRQMTSDKQFLDTATDVLVLSMNLAGASVSSATAKTILHGISAGVMGSKISIDKNYYYEKTIPALVASMNAKHQVALIPIVQATRQSISDYPFEQAVSDLDTYYFAGTIQMAINSIQADAAVKQQKAEDTIAALRPLPPLPVQDLTTKANLAETLRQLNDVDAGNIARIRMVLGILKVPGYDPAGTANKDVKPLLRKFITQHTDTPSQIHDVAAAFDAAEIPIVKANVEIMPDTAPASGPATTPH